MLRSQSRGNPDSIFVPNGGLFRWRRAEVQYVVVLEHFARDEIHLPVIALDSPYLIRLQ